MSHTPVLQRMPFADARRKGYAGATGFHGPGATSVVDGLRDGPVRVVAPPRVKWRCEGRHTILGEDGPQRIRGSTLSMYRWCPRCGRKTLQIRVRRR